MYYYLSGSIPPSNGKFEDYHMPVSALINGNTLCMEG
jgi:hypothetical protein